ncbi:hypothetical protein D3C86_1484070 [compost metagenome]
MHGAAKTLATHQLDIDAVALADSWQLGFFEVAADIKRIAVHQRHQWAARCRVVTLTGQQVGDVAADRRYDVRTLQVELRLGQCRHAQLHVGLGQHQIRLIPQ